MHALWAADDDITMWGSDEDERATGPEEVHALARGGRRVAERARLSSGRTSACGVEGDVAWVNARGTLWVNGESSPYRVTAVLVRRDGSWLWHTHSGSEPN